MASRKLIVEIVGDSSSLRREFTRSSKSSAGFERSLGRSARGAIVATGAFRSLGRSIAFASTAFLGGAGIVAVTKAAINAGSNLTEQINKSNVVFRGSEKQVQAWSRQLNSAFGITRSEALATAATFGNMLVPMGLGRSAAAKMSERLVELAGDMASFNNAASEDTLLALQAGLAGQVRPLRRFGVFLTQDRIAAEAFSDGIVKASVNVGKIRDASLKVASAQAKLTAVQRRYGAGTTQVADATVTLSGAQNALSKALGGSVPKLTNAQKAAAIYAIILKDTKDAQGDAARTSGEWAGQLRKLHASIGNLEEAIGIRLIGALNPLLQRMNVWLGQSRNQQRVIDALRRVMSLLGQAFHAATAVLGPLIHGIDAVARRLGGWKTALELAAGAWVGFKVAGISAALAVQVANVRAAFGVATAWRAALIATGWGAFAVAAGAAAAFVITHWQRVKVFFQRFWIQLRISALEAALDVVEPFSHLPSIFGGWARDAKAAILANLDSLRVDMAGLGLQSGTAFAAGLSAGLSGLRGPVGKAAKAFIPPGITGPTAPSAQAVPTEPKLPAMPALTVGAAAGEPAWKKALNITMQRLQIALSRAGLTASLKDDLAVLLKQEAVLKRQVSLHRGDLDLQQQLVDTQRQRLDLQKQIAENKTARRNARQFRALGLTATGEERALGVKRLRRILGSFEKNVSGTFLDTKKTRSVIAGIRKVLVGGLGEVGRDMKLKIKEILDALNQQLKDHARRQLNFRQANTRALLAGLGLDPATIKALRARFSQLGPGGTVPGLGVGAFGVAFPGGGTVPAADFATAAHQRPFIIHHTTKLDGRVVEQSTTKHQQTRRRRNPPQRRGRFAGGTV